MYSLRELSSFNTEYASVICTKIDGSKLLSEQQKDEPRKNAFVFPAYLFVCLDEIESQASCML